MHYLQEIVGLANGLVGQHLSPGAKRGGPPCTESQSKMNDRAEPVFAKLEPLSFGDPIVQSPRVYIIRSAVSCYGIYRSLHRYKAIRGPAVISSSDPVPVLAMDPLLNHEPDSQPPYMILIPQTSRIRHHFSILLCTYINASPIPDVCFVQHNFWLLRSNNCWNLL